MLLLLNALAAEAASQPLKSLQCEICTTVVGNVEDYVADPSNEEEIIGFLASVCEKLPDDFVGICDSIVNKHFDDLVDALVNQFPPEKACRLIGICDE